MAAAGKLAAFVNSYKFAKGEPLNIISHSHGGNVAIMAINQGLHHEVDNLRDSRHSFAAGLQADPSR